MAHKPLISKSTATAVACIIGMMVSVVPFHIGTFPLFLQPVSHEFGWGRAAFAVSLNMSAILAALAAPFVGRAVDRLGARRLLVPSIILYALATMAQSLLTPSKPQFYLTYAVLGFTEAVAGPVAFSHLISSWFQERRGLMLSLVIGAAPAVSLMIMAPTTHWLISSFGWRTAYLVLGLIILVLGAPAMAFLVKDPERAGPQTAAGRAAAVAALPGKSFVQVVTSVTYWAILVALVIHSLVVGGVRAHTVALLTDRGLPIGVATLAVSLSAMAGLLGNISAGVMLDRVQSPRIAAPFFVAALVGLLLLHHAVGAVPALIGASVLGFGIGAESGIGPYFFSRYFGMRSFGAVYGCLVSLLAISSGVGPMLLGMAFDRSGSYGRGLVIAEIGLAIGTVLIAVLGRYVYAARRTPQELSETSPPEGAAQAET